MAIHCSNPLYVDPSEPVSTAASIVCQSKSEKPLYLVRNECETRLREVHVNIMVMLGPCLPITVFASRITNTFTHHAYHIAATYVSRYNA